MFPKVRIVNTTQNAHRTRIWLDDVEVTKWCSGYRLSATYKGVTTLNLAISCGEVEVDGVPQLRFAAGAEGLLERHGWTPPPVNEPTE